jgi:hypothetical protein
MSTLLGDLDIVADYLETIGGLPTYLEGMAAKLRAHERRLRETLIGLQRADRDSFADGYRAALECVNGGPVQP